MVIDSFSVKMKLQSSLLLLPIHWAPNSQPRSKQSSWYANCSMSNKAPLSPTTFLAFLNSFIYQLSAYAAKHDPLYFTVRSIDGLGPDNKSLAVVQPPKDFEITSTLSSFIGRGCHGAIVVFHAFYDWPSSWWLRLIGCRSSPTRISSTRLSLYKVHLLSHNSWWV